MQILFIAAILIAILVLVSVFGLFFRGVFVLLPDGAQANISNVLSAINKAGQLLSLVSFPFIGAYIGSWWSTTAGIGGLVVGVICAIGLRSQFQTEDQSRNDVPAPQSILQDNAQREDQSNGIFQYMEGMKHLANRRFAAAAELFQLAIEKNPHPKYFEMLGTCQNSLGDTVTALQTWSKGIEIAPQDKESSDLYAIRALVRLNDLSDNSGAIMDYTQAIALLPEEHAGYKSGYLGNRARAFTRLENFDSALADFDEAVRLDPESASWIGERGAVKMGNGQFHEAITDFSRALQLDPACSEGDWKEGIEFSAQQIKE